MATLATIACGGWAYGQDLPALPIGPPAPPLPPAAELGRRLFETDAQVRALSVVVIVTGPAAYLDAIAAWERELRFPVLWDDGSVQARADIARFVHAFQPARVVRYEPADAIALPDESGARIARLERAVFDATLEPGSVTSTQQWVDALRADDALGPGIIITDPAGAQWPGGVALAAGRRQILAFAPSPGRLSAALSPDQASALERLAREMAEGLELTWSGMGDHVDAITIALDCPSKIRTRDDPPDFLATTDVLGRTDTGVRWAYVGQLSGNEPRSTYLAMSSLFLRPKAAWVFDGYEPGEPWSAFDGTEAANALTDAGLVTTVFDEPRQGLEHWRAACVRAIDAGLLAVNTMGNGDFFRLRPGEGAPGDMPIFASPPMVYFVHSFSATRPGNLDTVGGRLLDHGAYAYAGSVQEPTLAGFVPTPLVMRRLMVGLPFAAAVRSDDGPAWKIATFGDPLATAIPPVRFAEDPLPLQGVVDLGEEIKTLVGERRFSEALACLSMLARNDDASRLAAALLRDQPRSFDAKVAREALLPLFLSGKPDDVLACFRRLSLRDQKEPVFLDALWHAGRLRLYADTTVTSMLSGHLREDQLGPDAIELAHALAHQNQPQAAVGLLQSARNKARNERDRRQLDREIERLLGGRP
ncbi:MAG: hypothetical protein DYG94_09165 [Leptolyngbya sp. PLA3]|nr:MAG: hypothetical protein EDM82_12170 [Cyanobacteria bacterium CYA]MCE7968901.1 hypothetical protein [Leptolyngbya sp. PL-A3]